MSGVFGSAPEPPREDPSIAAERQRQQQAAESERIKAIQGNLRGETELDLASVFGSRSLLGPLGTSSSALRLGNPFQRAKRSLLGVG